MTESDLQLVYNYRIYLGYYEKLTDKEFVILDNGSMVGTHWTCFIVKDNKSN